jgi:hypothetical protein
LRGVLGYDPFPCVAIWDVMGFAQLIQHVLSL